MSSTSFWVLIYFQNRKRTWKKVELEKHADASKSQEDMLDDRVKKKHDKFC